MSDCQNGPCERLIQSEGALIELTRWQTTQNGSLARLADKVDGIAINIATMSANYTALVESVRESNEQMKWNRRIMYGTVITALSAVVGQSVGIL